MTNKNSLQNINIKSLFALGLIVVFSTFFTLTAFNSDVSVVSAHSNPTPIPTPTVTPAISPTPEVTPSATPIESPVATPSISPSPSPSVNIHIIQVLCPSYNVISGNADADKLDDTGGNFTNFINYLISLPHFLNPFPQKPVAVSEIPESCTRVSGTSFKVSTDEEQLNDVQTVGPTNTNGEINISTSDLNSALQNNLFSQNLIWLSGIQNNNLSTFGAMRCYNDAVNGDNLEFIKFSFVPSEVYCISYNVSVASPTPTPSVSPTPSASPVATPTPTSDGGGGGSNPVATPTPSPVPTSEPTPEPTPVTTSGGGGGGGSSSGGGSTGGSNNPGIGSAQPAEGYVNYSNVGSVAGTSTVGEVLGASTCTEYLRDYLRISKKNNRDQVVKLQSFLNSHMNAGLPVTGIYGKLTEKAVDNFQVKYWQDVLLPWVPHGLPTEKTPTQYVYKTTKWKINMIVCPELNLPVPKLP